MTDKGSLQAEVDRLRREMEVNPSWKTARLFKAAALQLLQADTQYYRDITGFDVDKLHEDVSN